MVEGLKRAKGDDPRRCQHVSRQHGQCFYQALEGSNSCIFHISPNLRNKLEKQKVYDIRNAQYKQRVGSLSDAEVVYNLKEDIGVLRLLIEERLNMIRTPVDMAIHAGPLSELIMKVKSCVEACNKMEQKIGNLLDKQSVLVFAQHILSVLSEELAGQEDLMRRVAEKLMSAIDPESKNLESKST